MGRKLRTYLSVPIIANREVNRARIIAKAVTDAGHELISPWVLDDIETRPDRSLNIFSRDVAAVKVCDLIVADVSNPSTGVGMEVMLAYVAGRKIILVKSKGTLITRMLTDMDCVDWVEYDDEGALYKNLRSTLKNIDAEVCVDYLG